MGDVQLGRRAGALNVDLMSNPPGERRYYRLCSRVVLEKRWKMFEGRAALMNCHLDVGINNVST